MALSNQPYLPLYIDDWMNNTKLKMCSPQAHGIMISIMCLMHKSDEYGVLLLQQKFKQSEKQIENFATQLAKITSFDLLEITQPLNELLEEKVIVLDGEKLICKRMVKDGNISKIRSYTGSKGGKSTQSNKSKFAKAKIEANSVIVNEIGIVNEDVDVDKGKGVKGEKPKQESNLIFKDGFKEVWEKWIEYRKAKKISKYAAEKYEQIAIDKLVSLSGSNPKIAQLIVDQTIENNWQGLFELKNKLNGTETYIKAYRNR